MNSNLNRRKTSAYPRNTSGCTTQSKLTTLGPLIGVTLLHGFTRKIGLVRSPLVPTELLLVAQKTGTVPVIPWQRA